jgi:small subunit ribosomal protein S20
LATHTSALKRARQNERRRLRNSSMKSTLKTQSKKVQNAIEEKNLQEAKKGLAHLIPWMTKASAKRVIHKKTAARKISRLAKKVNALGQS